ncbi:MAG: cupin domain-containing protein [Bacteroides sp.]|jgi:quercetin dioxygenase-like cupin family protein|nr:cupin domain-containing protein [Bacteroides sp.]
MIKKNTPVTAPAVPAAVNGHIMHSDSRAEAILLTLLPGEEIAMHKNPFDVLFCGISGKATLISPSMTETIEAGETIFVTADEDRAWKNNHTLPAKILVVKILK